VRSIILLEKAWLSRSPADINCKRKWISELRGIRELVGAELRGDWGEGYNGEIRSARLHSSRSP